MSARKPKVLLAMSGGVDSSVEIPYNLPWRINHIPQSSRLP